MGEHARPHGRHFLGPRLASDLVRNAGISRADLVVEIGAGNGVITRELYARAHKVIAVELDEIDAARLRKRFPRAHVVRADAREFRWPSQPFRVVGNLPFAHTTAILRHLLDDPARALLRADVIVEWGWAVKRCSMRPSTLLAIGWAPWFELTLGRRLNRSCFTPPPSSDAAVVTITRRPDPLLDTSDAERFGTFMRRHFGSRADATDLDVCDWVGLFKRSRAAGSSRRSSGRRS